MQHTNINSKSIIGPKNTCIFIVYSYDYNTNYEISKDIKHHRCLKFFLVEMNTANSANQKTPVKII
jgi:hypothetical protein